MENLTKALIKNSNCKKLLLSQLTPVSYTHLDVYKRQAANKIKSTWKNCSLVKNLQLMKMLNGTLMIFCWVVKIVLFGRHKKTRTSLGQVYQARKGLCWKIKWNIPPKIVFARTFQISLIYPPVAIPYTIKIKFNNVKFLVNAEPVVACKHLKKKLKHIIKTMYFE